MNALVRGISILAPLSLLPAVADEPAIGRAVTVEVVILEFSGVESPAEPESPEQTTQRLRRLETEGKAGIVTRMRLSTLENLPANIQFGENIAVPTGRMFSSPRMTAQTTYSREDTGTVVNVIPRIEQDGQILLELNVERSQFRPRPTPSQQGEESTADDPPPTKEILSAKTTLRVPDGETVIAHLMEGSSRDGSVLRAVLVTARAASPAARGPNS